LGWFKRGESYGEQKGEEEKKIRSFSLEVFREE
jgi:hypothetical protein